MRLIAEVVRISHAKFHCNRLTTVQDIKDYTSLIYDTHCTHTQTHTDDLLANHIKT